jgi:hypothetical protein
LPHDLFFICRFAFCFLLSSFILSFCVHASFYHQNFLWTLVGRSSVLLFRNWQPKWSRVIRNSRSHCGSQNEQVNQELPLRSVPDPIDLQGVWKTMLIRRWIK